MAGQIGKPLENEFLTISSNNAWREHLEINLSRQNPQRSRSRSISCLIETNNKVSTCQGENCRVEQEGLTEKLKNLSLGNDQSTFASRRERSSRNYFIGTLGSKNAVKEKEKLRKRLEILSIKQKKARDSLEEMIEKRLADARDEFEKRRKRAIRF